MEHLKDYPFIVNTAPTFYEKLLLFNTIVGLHKRKIAIVGSDTWNRIWDEKYGISNSAFDALARCSNTYFMVFPREGYPIVFGHEHLMIHHPDITNFNNPISSTQMRKNQNVPNA